MYDREDLLNLKYEYMNKDYPLDLNDYVISCIKSSQKMNNKNKTLKFSIYTNIVLSACLLIAVFYSYTNTDKSLRIKEPHVQDNIKSQLESKNFHHNNFEYTINENEFIVSIYPVDKDITIEDNILNINKKTWEIVNLKDILSDNIQSYTEISDSVKQILLNENSKFYVDRDGFYVIVGEYNSYKISKQLQNNVFKDILK